MVEVRLSPKISFVEKLVALQLFAALKAAQVLVEYGLKESRRLPAQQVSQLGI
jgi:hypothetical protein